MMNEKNKLNKFFYILIIFSISLIFKLLFIPSNLYSFIPINAKTKKPLSLYFDKIILNYLIYLTMFYLLLNYYLYVSSHILFIFIF
jgi:hypothetical protein